ncbi:ParA family protein [Mastigocladus laminosus UU774]|nr:ParA family protein [Mastigocladus laminosus UU774]
MSFNPEHCRNESEVESKLIVQYLLPQLGYTPDTWHQEVVVGSIRLDFLAFGKRSHLRIVMEAKHPKQNLNHHIYRLRHYLTVLNAEYGLLTNGKELRIYQKNKDYLQLVFNCYGKEIPKRINEIQYFIGRDNLPEKNIINNLVNITPHFTNIPVPSKSNDSLEYKRQNSMKTIAIYHNKGGVGKTTVSVNLAAALSKKGKRVLLIDIDSQANTTFATGLIKFQFEEDDDLRDQNVYHLLESRDFNFIPDIVRQSNYFNNPEIDVIPSHITLIEHQDKVNKIAATKGRLITKIKLVESRYDVIIIDTPPSRDYYAQVALISTDYLIITSDLKPFANQGLPTVIKFIKEVDEYREMIGKQPINIMGVLASKISTNSKFLQYTFPKQRDVILERYELPLMEAVIYDRTALSECMNQIIQVGDLEYPDPKSIIKYAESKASAQLSAEEFEILAMEVLKNIGG